MTSFYAVRSIGTILIAMLLALSGTAAAEAPELKADHPQRYTVTEGDTLWGIAEKFLKDPWRWPEIWQRNQDIKNPHLIYPGDVLVLTTVDGAPQVKVLQQRKLTKLVPTVRAMPREDPIPTIPPSAIQAFIDKPLIMNIGDLDNSGYVASGLEGKINLGKFSVFYGRGMPDSDARLYQIFRAGKKYVDPETNEFLGLQVVDVGTARMLVAGETAKMEVIDSNLEVSPGDRLMPAPKDLGFPYFEPRSPGKEVRGAILDFPKGVAEGGPFSVAVVSVGERDDLAPGHVLRILRKERPQRDPITKKFFEPPLEPSGLMILFRTFEKVSYALVTNANLAIRVGDVVETP